jgi:hypothetical protein
VRPEIVYWRGMSRNLKTSFYPELTSDAYLDRVLGRKVEHRHHPDTKLPADPKPWDESSWRMLEGRFWYY